jgi:hypothetical protein
VHNSVWFAARTDAIPAGADESVRAQIRAADWINLERGCSDTGLTGGDGQWSLRALLAYVDRVHSLGTSVVWQPYAGGNRQRELNLACLLLTRAGRDALDDPDARPSRWWAGFDADPGAPLGGRSDWEGLLRRDFEHAVVLVNDPGADARTVTLPGRFTRVDGRPVRGAVTVRGGRGVAGEQRGAEEVLVVGGRTPAHGAVGQRRAPRPCTGWGPHSAASRRSARWRSRGRSVGRRRRPALLARAQVERVQRAVAVDDEQGLPGASDGHAADGVLRFAQDRPPPPFAAVDIAAGHHRRSVGAAQVRDVDGDRVAGFGELHRLAVGDVPRDPGPLRQPFARPGARNTTMATAIPPTASHTRRLASRAPASTHTAPRTTGSRPGHTSGPSSASAIPARNKKTETRRIVSCCPSAAE